MSTVSTSIPAWRLWELYSYNPLTGKFHKRTKSGKEIKGWKSTDKRTWQIELRVNNSRTQCNYGRAVYAWCTGTWPEPTVDHIDRDPSNNRIQNLRPATYRQQNQNHGRFNGGVTYRASRQRWYAFYELNGHKHYAGSYPSREAAERAYKAALASLEGDTTG